MEVRARGRGAWVVFACLVGLAPHTARAAEFFDNRLQFHGYVESQIRFLNPNLNTSFVLAQWRNILNLETELDLAPDGFWFLDAASAYVRLEASYDCVWTRGCGLLRNAYNYGDRIEKAPRYYTDGVRNGFVGDDPSVNPVNPRVPYQPNAPRPGSYRDIPGIEVLADNASFAETFRPIRDNQFVIHQLARTTSGGDSSGIDTIFGLWRPKDSIDNVGTLGRIPNVTTPLSYRPDLRSSPFGGQTLAGGLYVPSPALRELYEDGVDFGKFDQNFSQNDLAWNHGASQDEHELKEAYLDLSTLEGRLTLRVGKQTVVWGKTELFRNTDQINPSDLALATLPSLEDSRIGLWAVRAIYSLFDVGPLQDVRAEAIWLFDDFEPNDVGRCGEPFSPLPVCRKQSQIFLHGLLGAGLVGETRPPHWWDSAKGNEFGARVEFRWDRFSFAITDFYHYDRMAHPRIIQSYSRKVDPLTGRPLADSVKASAPCVLGTEPGCLQPGSTGPQNALTQNPQNRQIFDVICSSSVGFFPLDTSGCALTLTSSTAPTAIGAPLGTFVSAAVAGLGIAQGALNIQLIGAGVDPSLLTGLKLVPLNRGPTDGTGNGFFAASNPLAARLSDPQEALLGCGPFYQSDCDLNGLDLFNAEASVVFQSWPGQNPGDAIARRYIAGQSITLPGAGGPLTTVGRPYNPFVDGCVQPGPGCGPQTLIDPRTGQVFPSELAAASWNALMFIIALDVGVGESDLGCAFPTSDPATWNAPLRCPTVQDFFSVTGTTRPELKAGGTSRFGRRDFVWAGVGELMLEYQKVNTLGFAMDFAEDYTSTNWGIEASWTPNQQFRNSEALSGLSKSDRWALTISMDRPTFVNFLNANRTFFFNMQWFFEYLPDYVGGGHRGFEVSGPFTQLGTITVQTGYFQDRLQPAFTAVWDVQSRSGALIFQTAFRFTANLSMTVGINGFFGHSETQTTFLGLGALGESNQRWSTQKYDRLNAVRERDELFAKIRYTF